MTSEPHPMRCATCNFLSRPYDYAECRFWNKCSVLGGEIDINRDILIAAVGCASHSSRRHQIPNDEQAVRQDEREKVLKVAIEEIEYSPFDGREALALRVEKKVRGLI